MAAFVSSSDLPRTTAERHRLKITQTLNAFAAYRQGKDKSVNTIRLDLQTMKAFVAIIGDIVVSRITTEQVDRFFEIRKEAGLGPYGINSDVRALRMYFKFAFARDLIRGVSPIAEQEMRKVTRRHRLYVPPERFEELLNATANPRGRILCALGLYLWQRQGEGHLLRVGDVLLDKKNNGGFVRATIPKTREIDMLPVSLRLHEELNGWTDEDGIKHVGWLEYYRRNLGVDRLDDNWYLVPQVTRGLYLNDGSMNRLLPDRCLSKSHDAAKYALLRMGYADVKGEGIHTLRRSGAQAYYRLLLAEGRGHESAIRTIMALLHHADMKTTEIYLGVTADRATRDLRIEGKDMYGEGAIRAARRNQNADVVDIFSRRKKA